MMSLRAFLVVVASVVSTISLGTSASAFNAISITDPYMKSSWRTQVVFLCYLITVIITWKKNRDHYIFVLKNRYLQAIVSGIMLGLHYCMWTLSLTITSVAHSLLLVSSTPLIIIVYNLLVGKKVKKVEIIGVFIGIIGLLILCLFGENTEGATWYGDIIAFGGAVAMWLHFAATEDEVETKPLFFLCFLHLIAAITCIFVSVLISVFTKGIEGISVIEDTFMYFYKFQGLYAIYLGVVVGFIGNGCLYYLLQNTSQLFTTIILFFEPITGTFFAWLVGFQDVISIYTWIGGSIIIIGNLLVTIVTKLKDNTDKTKISESLNYTIVPE